MDRVTGQVTTEGGGTSSVVFWTVVKHELVQTELLVESQGDGSF